MSRLEVPLQHRMLRPTGDTVLWADLLLSLKTNRGIWKQVSFRVDSGTEMTTMPASPWFRQSWYDYARRSSGSDKGSPECTLGLDGLARWKQTRQPLHPSTARGQWSADRGVVVPRIRRRL